MKKISSLWLSVPLDLCDYLDELKTRNVGELFVPTNKDLEFAKLLISKQVLSRSQVQSYLDAVGKAGDKISLEKMLIQEEVLTKEEAERIRGPKKRVLHCNRCKTLYRVEEEDIGKRFKCKQCGMVVVVPKPGQTQVRSIKEIQHELADAMLAGGASETKKWAAKPQDKPEAPVGRQATSAKGAPESLPQEPEAAWTIEPEAEASPNQAVTISPEEEISPAVTISPEEEISPAVTISPEEEGSPAITISPEEEAPVIPIPPEQKPLHSEKRGASMKILRPAQADDLQIEGSIAISPDLAAVLEASIREEENSLVAPIEVSPPIEGKPVPKSKKEKAQSPEMTLMLDLDDDDKVEESVPSLAQPTLQSQGQDHRTPQDRETKLPPSMPSKPESKPAKRIAPSSEESPEMTMMLGLDEETDEPEEDLAVAEPSACVSASPLVPSPAPEKEKKLPTKALPKMEKEAPDLTIILDLDEEADEDSEAELPTAVLPSAVKEAVKSSPAPEISKPSTGKEAAKPGMPPEIQKQNVAKTEKFAKVEKDSKIEKEKKEDKEIKKEKEAKEELTLMLDLPDEDEEGKEEIVASPEDHSKESGLNEDDLEEWAFSGYGGEGSEKIGIEPHIEKVEKPQPVLEKYLTEEESANLEAWATNPDRASTVKKKGSEEKK